MKAYEGIRRPERSEQRGVGTPARNERSVNLTVIPFT
jgi:hypothetical protein